MVEKGKVGETPVLFRISSIFPDRKDSGLVMPSIFSSPLAARRIALKLNNTKNADAIVTTTPGFRNDSLNASAIPRANGRKQAVKRRAPKLAPLHHCELELFTYSSPRKPTSMSSAIRGWLRIQKTNPIRQMV